MWLLPSAVVGALCHLSGVQKKIRFRRCGSGGLLGIAAGPDLNTPQYIMERASLESGAEASGFLQLPTWVSEGSSYVSVAFCSPAQSLTFSGLMETH